MSTNASSELVFNNMVDDMKQVTVATSGVVGLATVTKSTSIRSKIIRFIKSAWAKIVGWLLNTETWKTPKAWIAAAIFLRCAYIFMNEYGLNPMKKSLKGDHVFLTGAGSGIGRLMAIRLGLLGCNMSLSDVNVAGLEETKQVLLKAGIKESQIVTFRCDVSKKSSISEGAATAR